MVWGLILNIYVYFFFLLYYFMGFLHFCAIYLQLLTTLLIVFSRNPINCILLLIVVYTGAIAVLFLFVVMMLQLKSEPFNFFHIILISFILSLFFPKTLTLAGKAYCSKKRLTLSKKFNNSLLVTKRGLSTLKPRMPLSKNVKNLVENTKAQMCIMVAYLVIVYWYFWGFKLILPIILVDGFFLLLVVLHFNFVKTKKKTPTKTSWYGELFAFFYLIFCFMIALYFGLWIRIIFLAFFFLLLVWRFLPPTSEIRQKILPDCITNFLETYPKDTLIIQNYLIFDFPFVYSMRTSFYLYSLLLYILYIIVFSYPGFLGLVPEHIVFLIWSNLLTLMYLQTYELYTIWCCNGSSNLNNFLSFKTVAIAIIAFVGCQLMLNSMPEGPLSILPTSIKYKHQSLLGGYITVDIIDRKVCAIHKNFNEAKIFFPATETMDPHYPLRYDAKAYFDAMKAHKSNATDDEVVAILTRNSELARVNAKRFGDKTIWCQLIDPVPNREDLLESVAQSNERALKNAPTHSS